MTTYEQRELAGVSPVTQQTLPTDYYAEKKKKDDAHELALDQKAIRLLDGTNEITPYTHELTDTLWNPYDKVKNQLKEWDYRTISEGESLRVPYRRAA